MESVASSATPSDHHRHRRHRFRLTQPVSDRVARALHHDLRLLHRSDSVFFVLGATANVYTVNLSPSPSSCTCPDRITPCKHILFVLIRVLGVSPDDTRLLRRRTLRPCQLNRLLKTCTLPEAMAGAGLRERFRQLFFRARNDNETDDEGRICPVCLDEMRKDNKEERLVACETCKNWIHEDCWVRWKKSGDQRGAPSCVICRARWRDRTDQEAYLNLSAFVGQKEEEEEDHDDDQTALCGGE